jgi:hypothetical protein
MDNIVFYDSTRGGVHIENPGLPIRPFDNLMGIVTETGFEWVSGWDRITAWPRSPTADIGFRQELSSTRYGCISASP